MRTIDLRAGRYRSLVVLVAAACCGSLTLMLVFRAWAPAGGLLLLFPLCAAFFHADAVRVSRWRKAILLSWAAGVLDMETFRQALVSIPALPAPTVREMLGTLPVMPSLREGRRFPQKMREAFALTLGLLDALDRSYRAGATIVRLGTAGLAILALMERSWWPLAGLLAVPLVPAVRALMDASRTRRWRRQLAVLEGEGLEVPEFVWAARESGWCGVRESARDGLLRSLLQARPTPITAVPPAR